MNMGTSGDRLEHVLPRLLPQAAGGLGLLDLHAAFLEREGQLIPGLFTDGLHRNEAGYRVWRNRRNRRNRQVPLLAQQRHRKTS